MINAAAGGIRKIRDVTHLLIEIIKIIEQVIVEADSLSHFRDVDAQLIDLLLHPIHSLEEPDLR